MKYLLDVNALLALGFSDHQSHARVVSWIKSQLPVELITCPISELGFVRVLAQLPDYPYSVTEARTLLINLKKSANLQFSFIPDSIDISSLPSWAKAPKQTTDGYLLQLAKSHGAALATFDRRIPGATYIP